MRFPDPAAPSSVELAAGVPRHADYEALFATPAFAAMEADSQAFLARHCGALAHYARRWVADPLGQWSRRWEYPYAFAALAAARGARATGLRVLDAGSGVTFFPFHVASRLDASVVCCDSDPALATAYARIGRASAARVTFASARLQALPWRDRAFDAVTCISVLEHTADYPAVLAEFERVLVPHGMLVVTFDVSIDGGCDITPDAASVLVAAMASRFEPADLPDGGLSAALRDPGRLTTAWARRHRPESLPWRRSLRGDFARMLRLRSPAAPFHMCTVWCGAFRRKG